MARLSKNERIRQHKLVYGKTFIVEVESMVFELYRAEVRVTKLIKKGQNDVMYVTCKGALNYEHTPFRFYATVTWTKNGPAYRTKGGDRGWSDPNIAKQIVRGCENILMEVTILGGSNEQKTETRSAESEKT